MSQRSAEKMQDFLVWFHENRRNSMGVPERLAFMEKALECLVMNTVDLLEDVTDLEGRPRESIGRRIWTTQGINLRGDVRRIG